MLDSGQIPVLVHQAKGLEALVSPLEGPHPSLTCP